LSSELGLVHNVVVLGRGRGYDKKGIRVILDQLISDYERLIFDYTLNPKLLEAFNDRVRHAESMGRDPEKFLGEELKTYKELENKTIEKKRIESTISETKHRRLAGESFADKILNEYKKRIEHYPSVHIHEHADPEVCKLYGAMHLLDRLHWGFLTSYLKRVYPRAGQLDRTNIEQRFWRLVSTREGRIPEELESYRRALTAPTISQKDRIREGREAIKMVAFYLHDLLEIYERAAALVAPRMEVRNAINFVYEVISDFRIGDLKKY